VSLRALPLLSRIYLAFLLLATVLVGPTAEALIAVPLLFVHAAALYRSPPERLDLLFTVLTFLLTPLGLTPLTGPFLAVLLQLPVIPLLDGQLRALALHQATPGFREGMWATSDLNVLVLALGASAVLGVMAGSPALAGAAAVLLFGMAARLVLVLQILRRSPLEWETRRLRVLAGSQSHEDFRIKNRCPFTLTISISSPSQWVTLRPTTFQIGAGQDVSLEMSIVPHQAGRSDPTVQVEMRGPWGLLAMGYLLTPLELHVIPRARYAVWLAKRYLEATRAEQSTLMVEPVTSQAVRGRGVEFDSLRRYETRDSLRDIDWPHTLKFNELVVKEFADPAPGSVVLLVNLETANAEEADWLAYNLVMSSLSAARQGMPIKILAYNQREPMLATGPMSGRQGVKRALQLSTRVAHAPGLERVLAPPDASRLRKSIRQLEVADENGDAAPLRRLLSLELTALEDLASRHPLTYLVRTLLERGPHDATVTLVSHWTHDADALAIALPLLRSRGYRVIDLFSERR
jgi:uncharacterized protein (DUF58 family)